MKSAISDVGKVLAGMKKVFSCRVLRMNVKIKVRVAVSTVLYDCNQKYGSCNEEEI